MNRVLTFFAPGPIAGAEKVVITGFNALTNQKSANFEFSLLLVKEKSAPEYCDNFIKEIESKQFAQSILSRRPFDLKVIRNLNQILKEKNISLIHTHGYKALIYTFIWKFLTRSHIKIIHTHHGNTSHSLKVKLYERLAETIMRRIDGTIAVSPVMKAELTKKGVKNLFHVPNMISFKKKIQKNEHQDITKFFFIGRLSPEKGPSLLIEAFKKLEVQIKDSNKENNIELHFVGNGPLLENLQKNANQRIFYHGFQIDTVPFYQNTTFLCLPSYKEGMPMTAIEAVCNGIPIIANSVGALPDILHPESSLLNPMNDYLNCVKTLNHTEELVTTWIALLTKAIQNKETLLKKANEFKDSYSETFSSTTWVTRTLDIYRKIH